MYQILKEDIAACEFLNWTSLFTGIKCLSPYRSISLPDNFIEYLQSDGIILPEGVDTIQSGGISDDEDVHEVMEDISNTVPLFTTLNDTIRKYIQELGGKVFIKLNWSAPLDSIWINGGTIQCSNLKDIYLLLKSSDRILFDIDHMYSHANKSSTNIISPLNTSSSSRIRPEQVTLILRKWQSIHNSMEFRCFIYNNELIGICQRDCSSYFEFLKREKNNIISMLSDFYQTIVKGKFPRPSYTMDVFIDTREVVWLIDFNVFGLPTNSLLFDWNEIIQMHYTSEVEESRQELPKNVIEYRIVSSRDEVLPSEGGLYRGPIDVTMSKDFSNFVGICKQQQLDESFSEDGSEDS